MLLGYARLIVLAATLVIVWAPPLRATMIEPMGLEQIAHDAARIVQGTVTAVRSGRDDAGLPATWVTLAVAQTLKGAGAADLTFKQYGVATPLADGTITRVAGLPRYQVGEEVVLFLRGTSRRGFTSPVGLAQGVYRVGRAGAHPLARSELAPGQGARDLAAFLAEVARLAAEHP
jgi:hypothetical protein